MKASYTKYNLNFKRASGTSRGIIKTKETWFLKLEDGGKWGIGECAVFRGLSYDDKPDYEQRLHWVCEHINKGEAWLLQELKEYPSIQFGIETAFRSLAGETPYYIYNGAFSNGQESIPINGLIWMGDIGFMTDQIAEKLTSGFTCIKLKIGALDFDTELKLLEGIRLKYDASKIILRVDANGAFAPQEAPQKLAQLAQYNLHSIEQPIRQGNIEEMAKLCATTPLPIALDEELIGITGVTKKRELLQRIQPQYIILKPSLVGGFSGSDEWITLAEENNIGWWITSALESNIGLNAIAQWTASLDYQGHQGLGTGGLFTNNVHSPLEVKRGVLQINTKKDWILNI